MRASIICVALLTAVTVVGCGSGGINSNELAIPALQNGTSGTAQGSPQFGNLGEVVPPGMQVTFVGDVITVRGIHFRRNMKFFFGLNNQLALRPDSIFTTERYLLPGHPFVYQDPLTQERTVLEVEAHVDYVKETEIRVTIPAALSCSAAFTNPIVRMYGDDGSSIPETDIYFVVGPMCVALTPNQGVDIGGFSVAVHGDRFSPHTQIAFEYVDPADGITKVVGDRPQTDIEEVYITRNTLVVPRWPGIVPDSTHGLARPLPTNILIFESIDSIAGDLELEPTLGGIEPCDALKINGEEGAVALQENGVRNHRKNGAFTFLPTGVTDYPSIAGITPESGSEVGGNTVIIHGDQFDAFTADISNPLDPGVGVECPPDSGHYVAPLQAILVDRQTLVLKMPPCSVDIPEKVNFCLRNKFSIDNPGGPAAAGPNGDCVIFEDIYEYIPVPPILPPVVTAVYPVDTEVMHDYGLERMFIVGDWFDSHTELNGGVEFLLWTGDIVQSQRTILHNRNLIEVFTRRLPDSVYPLGGDLSVDLRVRNVIGHADFEEMVTFAHTPDAEAAPSISELCPAEGPQGGGNQVMVFGSDFDTTTQIFFGSVEATDVQFIHSGLVIATAPAAAGLGIAPVTAVDDGEEESASLPYSYSSEPEHACATLGYLNPDEGSATGGYTILAYGVALSPLTRIEFGVGDGNFSHDIFFVGGNLLRVGVPEALPAQIGATVDVGATDPLNGCTEVIKTVPFTYGAPEQRAPEILFVDTTVEVPITPTNLPALNTSGGDRMLVIGRYFDQKTTFDIEKPLESGNSLPCLDVTVLTPNLAVMTSPASPDEAPGVADLQGHNSFGDGNEFPVEYVQPGPPSILDVRNLDDGTQTSPIDSNDRLLVFGDNFFQPLTVRLTGCDLHGESEDGLITVELFSSNGGVTVVEDHLIGVNVPPDTFCEGPLAIEVVTEFGTASFSDEEGDPIFLLVGPQPPEVRGVFDGKFNSAGGEQAIFFGRNFTETTEFAVRSDLSPGGAFTPISPFATLFVSETIALVSMPPLPGGLPPVGVAGDVRAEETDPALIAKINGPNFTVSEGLFRVCEDAGPILLGVFPDHGFVGGGEQVLLLGTNFVKADGTSNVSDIHFLDPELGALGDYVEASPEDLPLNSLDPDSRGQYVILSDNQILVVTNPRGEPISPEDFGAPADVILESENGDSQLLGGYTYLNTPAVRTPVLLGLTPNETRLNGGTSHLLSGMFLTEADRIVFTESGEEEPATLVLDLPGGFAEVNDSFLVFLMPNLEAAGFEAGDLVDVHAEKDVGGSTLFSNTLEAILSVTFAGPPTLTVSASPSSGGAFGGTVVELTGTNFTSNSQVLFGTIPARHVVYVGPTTLYAVSPNLPLNVPDPGIDLLNIGDPGTDGTVDLAVFTQGGWAVQKDGFTFLPVAPVPTLFSEEVCILGEVPEGGTIHVVFKGDFLIPGDTVVGSSVGSTISNIEVSGFTRIEFDYTANTFATQLGPIVDHLTVETSQGTLQTDCQIIIHLTPFFSDCTTSYEAGNGSVPTTGVANGAFVQVTVTGGNFLPGGVLTLTERTGNTTNLVEAALSAGGRFQVTDNETLVFTVPNRFSSNVPTLLDGNPNVGPVDIAYTTPHGLGTSGEDCFAYVPAFADFDDFAYTIPTVDPVNTAPDKPVTGDVNADGVLDVVVLARELSFSLNNPEAFVYLADTFGDLDVNGDGEAPDFAGTFTKFTISNNDVKTELGLRGRGAVPILANLDGDDQLEIVLPANVKFDSNAARVLIVDVESDGSLGAETILKPETAFKSEAVSGIATGNFDDEDEGLDIAILVGHSSTSWRQISFFSSTGTDFSFTNTSTGIIAPYCAWNAGMLGAGDFDGDGDHDLIFGQSDHDDDANIVVVEIDASEADADDKVVSQLDIGNLTGGGVHSLAVFDADGDGHDDAFLLFENEVEGSLVGPGHLPGGVAIILDPFDLDADAYHLTGFSENGRGLGAGDVNADGIPDLVAGSTKGEFILFYGDGEGGMTNAGRSWTLPSVPGYWISRSHGLAVGDLNRDGLAEVFMGDLGNNPQALIVWLNQSR